MTIQETADKYPNLDTIHLAIMEIARLSHAGKHGQRVRELLVLLLNTQLNELLTASSASEDTQTKPEP